MADLYIPKRIKVGYQDRTDTYTKRLAYVICFDPKGKLRKEQSWEGWRDKKIPAKEFDNIPHPGFILNKGHTRYNWSHFGNSRRTVVRVYDDRGIEFEISPENLVGLLMETTCSKRVIEGECVYAWAGKDLVLLPTNSEEYTKAKVFTDRQDLKISAKDLKPGCSYTTKKGEEVIYIGRYNWFEWKGYGSSRISKKAHIFAHPKEPKYGSLFFPKDGAGELASLNNTDTVANYAELVDKFNGTINSSTIVSWESKPIANINLDVKQQKHYADALVRTSYAKMFDDRIDFYEICQVRDRYNYDGANIKGYRIWKAGSINKKTNSRAEENGGSCSYNYSYDDGYSSRNYGYPTIITKEKALTQLSEMVDIYMVLESGKKLKVKSLSDYSS